MKWGTKVKYFRSDDPGAPVKNGTPGSLLNVLDAILVNGYNEQPVLEAEILEGNIVLTCTMNNPFRYGQVVLLEGADNTSLNREYRVIEVNNQLVTLEGEDLNDGPITGNLSSKLAPLGWLKLFSGTNQAVYKPSMDDANFTYYRFDDRSYASTQVFMYDWVNDAEGVTGINEVDGHYLYKSRTANADNRPWIIVGDSYGFFLNTGALAAWSGTLEEPDATSWHLYGPMYIGEYISNVSSFRYSSVCCTYYDSDTYYRYPGLLYGYSINNSLSTSRYVGVVQKMSFIKYRNKNNNHAYIELFDKTGIPDHRAKTSSVRPTDINSSNYRGILYEYNKELVLDLQYLGNKQILGHLPGYYKTAIATNSMVPPDEIRKNLHIFELPKNKLLSFMGIYHNNSSSYSSPKAVNDNNAYTQYFIDLTDWGR